MIDPVVLGGVINDLATMETAIGTELKGLRTEFEKVGVSTQPITDLTNVANWLHGELPMLRRRHTAAVLLESQGLQFSPGTKMLSIPEDPAVATKQAGDLAVNQVRAALDGKPPGRDGVVTAIRALERIRNTKGRLGPDDLLFLETFYKGLGKDLYKVPQFLKNDDNWIAPTRTTYAPGEIIPAALDPKTRAALASSLVGGLLSLSDERRGGSWNRLPKFVQEAAADKYKVANLHDGDTLLSGQKAHDLADFLANSDGTTSAGVVLSKRLAITAAESAEEYKRLHSGLRAPENDSTARTFLQLAGRSEQAMHDLLTNQQMGPEGDPTGHVFDGYGDPKKFLLAISTHAWSDDGKAASAVTNWIADASRSTDPQRSELAHEAMQGLVTTLADPSVMSQLMDIDGRKSLPHPDSDALGQVNPELARSLVRDTAAFFKEFSDPGAEFFTSKAKGMSDGEEVGARWFTLVSTDPTAAEALAAAVYREKVDGLHAQLHNPTEVLDIPRRAGQLQGLLDAGLHNVGMERTGDKEEAKQAADDIRGKALGVVGHYLGKAGTVPGLDPVEIADKILGGLIGPDTTPVDPQQIETYGVDPQANGASRMLIRYEMTNALIESGQIKVEDLPDEIRGHGNPPRLMSPAEFKSADYNKIAGAYEKSTAGVPGVTQISDKYLTEYSDSYSTVANRRTADIPGELKTKLGIG
jgi:hypothetical protein